MLSFCAHEGLATKKQNVILLNFVSYEMSEWDKNGLVTLSMQARNVKQNDWLRDFLI